MSLAPADRARRKYLKQTAVNCASHGEGFYLIDFGWQPFVSMFDLSVADDLVGLLQADRCFRAVARTKKLPNGSYDTVVIEVGGEDHVYAVNVNFSHKNPGTWIEPPETELLEVQFLRRV